MKNAFNANKADFTGINGGNDLYLTAFSQLNDLTIGHQGGHRQARQEHEHHEHDHDHHHEHHVHQVLKFERQFLYAIRHNPSGMITYLGRYYEPPEAGHHNGGDHDHHHDHMHS